MRRSLAAVACMVLLSAGVASAQLPPTLQQALTALDPGRRVRLEVQARRWQGWTGAEREAFAARARAWDALPVAERQQRREAWAAWRRLPPDERMLLRRTAARFAALPTERRQALRARFEAMDVSRQRGWMLGPVLGVDYPALQPLLAQVPRDEHPGLLLALRSMTPGERADLAVLVLRTPPEGRALLRRELVASGDAGRAQWLRRRLAD